MDISEKLNDQITKLIEEAYQIAPSIISIKNKNNFSEMIDFQLDHERFVIWNTQCLNILSRINEECPIYLNKFLEEENKGTGKPGRHGRPYHSISIEVFYKSNILKALQKDILEGNIFDLRYFITADAFETIIDQAEYLLKEKYKDGSAVLTGAILESTLRKLCDKNKITYSTKDTMNPLNDKLKGTVYNTFTHKQIIAWADIRNNAAHGHFDKYSQKDVVEMFDWTKNFISQYLK